METQERQAKFPSEAEFTEAPGLLEDSDFEALRAAGWDDQAVYEATALIALFNLSGRLEAASGLPMDQPPPDAQYP